MKTICTRTRAITTCDITIRTEKRTPVLQYERRYNLQIIENDSGGGEGRGNH